jgi:hypothetical protein
MNAKLIAIHAPPTPACFPDRLQWVAYLVSAQEVKHGVVRPFKVGRFDEAFNHCADCDPAYRRQMLGEGRCNPPVVRTAHREKAAA